MHFIWLVDLPVGHLNFSGSFFEDNYITMVVVCVILLTISIAFSLILCSFVLGLRYRSSVKKEEKKKKVGLNTFMYLIKVGG